MKYSSNRLPFLSRVLIKLGGESPQLLARCSEKAQVRAAATGLTLLVPASIAALGSGYMIWWMSKNLTAALTVGAVWGMLLFLIDRALLTTLKKGFRGLLGLAVRLLLAATASAVFAHPLVLVLFGGEITRRIELERRKELTSIENRADLRVAELRTTRQDDLDAIDARHTALRQRHERLLDDQDRVTNELAAWRRKLDDEINGRRGSRKQGDGPLADQIRKDNIRPLEELAVDLSASLRELAEALRKSADEHAATLAAIQNDPEVASIRDQRDRLAGVIETQGRDDILSRFKALHRIMAEDQTVAAGYYTICLLLILCELTPLLAKLTAPKDEYDLEQERIVFRARQDLRVFRATYPPLAAQRTTEQLRLEAEKGLICNRQELAMEHLRFPRLLALQLVAEREAIFTLVDKELAEACDDMKRREVIESVCNAILGSFEESTATVMATTLPGPSAKHETAPAAKGAASQNGGLPTASSTRPDSSPQPDPHPVIPPPPPPPATQTNQSLQRG